MTWNFNIDEAPKGLMIGGTDIVKGKERKWKRFYEDHVLVATKCGKVFESHLTPDGRWYKLAKGEKPVAWQHKPEHPNA